MKRKVAAVGRLGGEFSWSMSVKTGRKRDYRGIGRTANVRFGFVVCLEFSGICSVQMLMRGTNSVFSGKSGNTRNGVEEKAHLAQSQTVTGAYIYYIGRHGQVKSDKEAKNNGNRREDQSETEEL